MKTKKASRKKPYRRSSSRRKPARRIFGLRWHHFGGLTLLVIGIIWGGAILVFQPNGHSSADSCSVSSELVNSCRPWLGATAFNYDAAASDSTSQILYHESRIGRQLDIVHTYHAQVSSAGKTQGLTSTDTTFATRANTMLFANWKPGVKGDSWATIASGADDTYIDEMADSIKALGSTKIFLTIWHEPENDVSPGGDPNCPNVSYKGTEGSTTDYVNMWHHVESVFNSRGVTNVVWVLDFMNYSPWDCLIPDLYPGSSYIDWVVFNAYQDSYNETFESDVKGFEDVLTNDTTSADNFTSKPWGIVEWGADATGFKNGSVTISAAQATTDEEAYYASAKTALDNNDSVMSKLKMYMIFDENDQGSPTGTNDRVGYDDNGTVDTTKGSYYYAFADDPRFTDAFYAPPPDTTPPTVTLTSPSNGATVSGTITVSGTASDSGGVSSVSLYVDGVKLASDSSSPYSFSLDTTKYTDGSHSLQLKATDKSGNVGSSTAISVTVKNTPTSTGGGSTGGSGGGSGGGTSGGGTTTISAGGSSSTTPIPVKGTITIAPSTPGGSVKVTVDGKTMTGTTVNTNTLTNGTHTLMINENGKTIEKKIVVHNPWPTAIKNELEVHKTAFSAGASTIIAVAFALVWVFRRRVSFWLLKHIHLTILKRFGISRLIRLGLK